MGLFDDDNFYFDPQTYAGGGGGLMARLFPHPQGDGGTPSQQPSPFDGTAPAAPVRFFGATMPTVPVSPAPASAPSAASTSPVGAPASPSISPTPDYGQTQNIAIGNYQMPQFGRAPPLPSVDPNASSPSVGDRLYNGFQSWAHTPLGNPVAGIANGIAGFDNAGIGTNATAASPTNGATPSSPGLGDRLYAGFQSWAHSPLGNPVAGIANGIAGFNNGQAVSQPGGDDVMSQYQALRARYGERVARYAAVDPQFSRALLAQPSAEDNADGPAPSSPPSPPSARPPQLRPAAMPAATSPGGRALSQTPNSSRKPPINIRRSTAYGQ